VIQQRIDGSLSFNQTWATYKTGFGRPDSNFWLGLEKIFSLTGSGDYRLRFEVLLNGNWFSDEYNHFRIDGEGNFYTINVVGYTGDNCDIMNQPGDDTVSLQNGAKFSTFDRGDTYGCASSSSSGNWFGNCFAQNVNGVY
ncbi:hypothetical protein HELRODRAFT_145478, partial [Helobdella robusta]|uniref:Fibrinogen C-terminal domain-containing protein n=1 Tax=Helobdella robusta TaxID=6412 RepID=T1EJK4_HELRO